jgi:carbonic anhydrase
MVIGHKDCGMANATADGLKEKMIARGISEDAIKVIEQSIDSWVDSFHHPLKNVENVVRTLRSNPFIPKDIPIHGLIIDPEDGHLELIVDGYEFLVKK